MPEQLERYHKIMNLYWFINGLKKDQKSENNRPTIFVHCMGHIGEIEVEIFPKGWSVNSHFEFNHSEHSMQKFVYEDHESYHLSSATKPEVWDECIGKLEQILERCRDESNQSIPKEA